MKKFIAILLMISIWSAGINAFASDDKFLANVSDLSAYDIVLGDENGDLRVDDYITRSEAVAMMCRMLNVTADAKDCIFTDVEKDFWAAGYITAAYQNGLVNGCGGTIFKPSNSILYKEMLKMLVIALGYFPRAKDLGGYPYGYISVADEIGLSHSVDANYNVVLTREDVINLIHTALDIPIMQQSSYGPNSEYTIMNGENNIPLITFRKILNENN